MDFDPSRIRRGEALAGASAVALLVCVFVLQWYGPRADGARPVAPLSGWQAFTVWRWVALITILASFGLVIFQATRRAPSLPAGMSVVVTALALLITPWLAVHVLFDHPPHQRIGAVCGLVSAGGVLVGGFLSLRQEGIAARDEPVAIPTVTLGRETS
jgi:hypothetical protein